MVSLSDFSSATHRLRRWWTVDLWSATALRTRKSRSLERLGIHLARMVYIVATGFRTERIKLRASQLTYVSLLSFVPALVVVFSIFAAFAGLSDVQQALKRFVVESLAVSHHETVTAYLERFVDQAGAIGGFGVLVLLITVISLLSNIERAFNDIWGIRRDRTLVQRFQVYWPLVTLGPIFVGLSLSLTAAFETSHAVQHLVAVTPLLGLVFKLLPMVFTWGSLTLLYMFLPNTLVPFRCAVIGGVVAGTLWEAAKHLYAVYAGFALKAPSVYGSLGAVPLFILWLWVSWVLALLGATVTFAVQNVRTYEPEDETHRRKSQRDREFVAARLLAAISDSFERGAGAVTEQSLLDEVAAQPRFAHRVLDELVETGLVVATTPRKGEDAAYVPGRPLHVLTMADVIRAMRRGEEGRADVYVEPDDVLGQRVCQVLIHAEEVVDRALQEKKIVDLLTEARAATARDTRGSSG